MPSSLFTAVILVFIWFDMYNYSMTVLFFISVHVRSTNYKTEGTIKNVRDDHVDDDYRKWY